MKNHLILSTALAIFATTLVVIGCGPYRSCPDQSTALYVEMETGEFTPRTSASMGSIDEGSIRYPADETYIRVVSDSQFEIFYREDDEVVVETYTVKSRDTVVVVN